MSRASGYLISRANAGGHRRVRRAIPRLRTDRVFRSGCLSLAILASALPGSTRRARSRLAAWLPTLLGLVLVGLVLRAYLPFLDSGFAATDSLPLVETSRLNGLGDVARLFSARVMSGTTFAQ